MSLNNISSNVVKGNNTYKEVFEGHSVEIGCSLSSDKTLCRSILNYNICCRCSVSYKNKTRNVKKEVNFITIAVLKNNVETTASSSSLTTQASPKSNTPLLDKNTKLVLSIVIPSTVAVTLVTTCLVIFCYHKCKKQEDDVEMEEFHGELNEEYGTYYSLDGKRMIESEAEDTNVYYGVGDMEDTGSTMITDNNPEYE